MLVEGCGPWRTPGVSLFSESCLKECFPSVNRHTNHLGILECRFCLSNELLDNASAAWTNRALRETPKRDQLPSKHQEEKLETCRLGQESREVLKYSITSKRTCLDMHLKPSPPILGGRHVTHVQFFYVITTTTSPGSPRDPSLVSVLVLLPSFV